MINRITTLVVALALFATAGCSLMGKGGQEPADLDNYLAKDAWNYSPVGNSALDALGNGVSMFAAKKKTDLKKLVREMDGEAFNLYNAEVSRCVEEQPEDPTADEKCREEAKSKLDPMHQAELQALSMLHYAELAQLAMEFGPQINQFVEDLTGIDKSSFQGGWKEKAAMGAALAQITYQVDNLVAAQQWINKANATLEAFKASDGTR